MVLGGMISFRGSLLAGIAIGVGQSLLRFNVDSPGVVELALFGAVLVVIGVRARNVEAGGSMLSLSKTLRPIPERAKQIWWVRRLPAAAYAMSFVAAIALVLIVDKPSRILLYATVLAFASGASYAKIRLDAATAYAGALKRGPTGL